MDGDFAHDACLRRGLLGLRFHHVPGGHHQLAEGLKVSLPVAHPPGRQLIDADARELLDRVDDAAALWDFRGCQEADHFLSGKDRLAPPRRILVALLREFLPLRREDARRLADEFLPNGIGEHHPEHAVDVEHSSGGVLRAPLVVLLGLHGPDDRQDVTRANLGEHHVLEHWEGMSQSRLVRVRRRDRSSAPFLKPPLRVFADRHRARNGVGQAALGFGAALSFLSANLLLNRVEESTCNL
ncbi:hypothetical protein FJV41_20800 [Myxococcus llanfairpwllgwyngyllgogerychwyrndrobwllllantysiliogogogochensis]|uniref:Uncharacterized protein n=1 Tax=Myxococcus llanfairpwllgwyngyllgogerychwyrndrobwllllantysiliogogogochensis TaxID=2590453 RepID=A0A540WYL6_9BACT|nr:hypothetical protein [Myxococcus llanfairpwllgwyngyllgogerychwyrndrobwllllantysiliogogogochensis]TQF14040.1 hypothetical protein FJV41_20800 [Myxococcus llanfairpwllgwyngyllgogerychwyrndrobwllllantysiliogogogochensis]